MDIHVTRSQIQPGISVASAEAQGMGSLDEVRDGEPQEQLPTEEKTQDNVPAPTRKPDVRRRRPRSRFGSNDYVPPFRAARQAQPTGERERAVQTQRNEWLAMKKKINGVINRLNASNLRDCVVSLLRLNIIRGKGVFCKALMRAQLASADFSDVYAAFVSIVNTRVPEVGELLVCRLILQLKDGYASQEKLLCVSSLRFLAHLFNQQVINELPLLEFMSTCLIDPSGASIELAVLAMQECGHCLSEKSPRAAEMVFTRLREVLHDDAIEKRMQTLVDNVLELRRKKFKAVWTLKSELDIVDDGDVIPHFFSLEDVTASNVKEELNSFSFDPEFEENESKYGAIRAILVGDDTGANREDTEPDANKENAQDDGASENAKDKNSSVDVNAVEAKKPVAEKPEDMTASQLVDFRRIVYLKIMSAASYEECAHKLTKLMKENQGKEVELCNMVIECCSQEKTFLRYYGLLGQRLCLLAQRYIDAFEENFAKIYGTVHRYDTRKIRNIASFYASLLASNALPWAIMMVVHLVEEETTASSRIFLKILFQETAKSMGSTELIAKLGDPDTAKYLSTVFRRDEAKNTRFAINFFTSIGLGYLTDELREFLTQMPKKSAKKLEAAKEEEQDDADSLSSSSLSSSSLSSSSGLSGRDVPERQNGNADFGRADKREDGMKDSEESVLKESRSPMLRLKEKQSPSPRSRSPADEMRNPESRRKKSSRSSTPRSFSSDDSSVYSRRRSRDTGVGGRDHVDSSPGRRRASSRSPRRYRSDADRLRDDRVSPRESPRRESRRRYLDDSGRSLSPPPRSRSREARRGYNRDDRRDPSPKRSPVRPRRGYGDDDSDRDRSPRRRSASRGSRRGYRSRSSSPARRSPGSHNRRRRSRSSSSGDSSRSYARRRRRSPSSSSSGETRKRKASPREEDLDRRKERKMESGSRRHYSSDSSASVDRSRGRKDR